MMVTTNFTYRIVVYNNGYTLFGKTFCHSLAHYIEGYTFQIWPHSENRLSFLERACDYVSPACYSLLHKLMVLGPNTLNTEMGLEPTVLGKVGILGLYLYRSWYINTGRTICCSGNHGTLT